MLDESPQSALRSSVDGFVEVRETSCTSGARKAPTSRRDKSIAVVIDNDALMRRAAADLLRRDLKFASASTFGSIGQARAALDLTRATLLLLDATLLNVDPSHDVLQLRADVECPIVIFVGDCDDQRANKWIEEGASAVLDRRVDRAGFCEAIRLVTRGERFCQVTEPPPVDLWMNFATLERRSHGLRPRHRQILRMIACGARNRDIARTLGLCEPTVKAHIQAIFVTLRVINRTRAAICANWLIARGLL